MFHFAFGKISSTIFSNPSNKYSLLISQFLILKNYLIFSFYIILFLYNITFHLSRGIIALWGWFSVFFCFLLFCSFAFLFVSIVPHAVGFIQILVMLDCSVIFKNEILIMLFLNSMYISKTYLRIICGPNSSVGGL